MTRGFVKGYQLVPVQDLWWQTSNRNREHISPIFEYLTLGVINHTWTWLRIQLPAPPVWLCRQYGPQPIHLNATLWSHLVHIKRCVRTRYSREFHVKLDNILSIEQNVFSVINNSHMRYITPCCQTYFVRLYPGRHISDYTTYFNNSIGLFPMLFFIYIITPAKDVVSRGIDPEGWVWLPENTQEGSQYVLTPAPKNVTFFHSKLLLDNCKFHVIKECERLVLKMEGKTNFSKCVQVVRNRDCWVYGKHWRTV